MDTLGPAAALAPLHDGLDEATSVLPHLGSSGIWS